MKRLLFLALCTLSCSPPEPKVQDAVRDVRAARYTSHAHSAQGAFAIPEDTTGRSLLVNDILFTFPGSVYLDTAYTVEIAGDTLRVWLEIGETIEDSLFTVDIPSGYQINIFERFQTSVVINAEGPHWDLTNWRHYDSKWREVGLINISGNIHFKGPHYSESDWNRSPVYERSELIDYLKSVQRADLATRLTSPKKGDYITADASISSIVLKVMITKPDGSRSLQFVEFEIPMGC